MPRESPGETSGPSEAPAAARVTASAESKCATIGTACTKTVASISDDMHESRHGRQSRSISRRARASFDAFTLSNILDAADVGYARRLQPAVEHADRPQAVMVMRSFAEPNGVEEDECARQDRAPLWSAIKVTST